LRQALLDLRLDGIECRELRLAHVFEPDDVVAELRLHRVSVISPFFRKSGPC
jgi:hypothetical protein